MHYLITNFAKSSLASSVSAGGTSLTVQTGDGSKFPAPGAGQAFYVLVGLPDATHELRLCTARSGATLTIDALQNAWPAGTQVINPVSAELLNSFIRATDTGMFATAAQGAKADTALQTAPVTSVAGKIGAVSLTVADIGGFALYDYIGSFTWSPGSIASGAQASTDVAVSGVTLADFVAALSCDVSLQGLELRGECVSGAVRVYLVNNTGASVSLAAGTKFYYGAKTNPIKSAGGGTAILDVSAKSANITISGGGLVASINTGIWSSVKATEYKSTGVHSYTATVTSGNNFLMIGLGDSAASVNMYVGQNGNNKSVGYSTNSGSGQIYLGGFPGAALTGSAFNAVAGDVLKLEWDADAGTVKYYKNGTLQGATITGVTGTLAPMDSMYGTMSVTYDFTSW